MARAARVGSGVVAAALALAMAAGIGWAQSTAGVAQAGPAEAGAPGAVAAAPIATATRLARSAGRAEAAAAGARILVVDANSPQADDAGPGTESKPFKTIGQAAKSAQPGDTVYVMEGRYDERVKLSVSGAKDKPITFVAVPARGVFMRGFHTNGQSYIRIQGFDITNPTPSYEGRVSDYEAGIQIVGSHVEAVDNFIHDLSSAVHGLSANDVHLAYNRFYKCQMSVLISGDGWTVENNAIERVIQYTKSDGDYCRGWGKNHVLRGNRFFGTHKFVKPGEVNEVPTAHLDCFQTWALKPYHLLQNFTFEDNMCEVFSQGCMIERDKAMDPNAISHLLFRRNIYWNGGAWGLCIGSVSDVRVADNTFVKINVYGAPLHHVAGGVRTNNLYVDVHADKRKPWWDDGNKETDVPDPLLADKAAGNFRLRKGSPLIGGGVGGATPGALEYPNVYYVDPRHPGASDDGFGYPGWPYKTAAKALAVAQSGETVVLRGGVYREALKPAADGVTIRAMKGEKVVVSGADLIQGWQRTERGWEAPLGIRPGKVLRDGQPWTDFVYTDYASRAAINKIILKSGGDPRLHVFEIVVRAKPIDLAGRKDVKVEGIEIVNTLGE